MQAVDTNPDTQKTKLISFVLPVCNEEDSLKELYQKIVIVMEDQSVNSEIIFVDDGSIDNSFTILSELQQQDQRVSVIQFRKNFGKAAAYSAGFDKAKGEVIITMDTDLQDSPDDIPMFVNKINEGFDLVVGWRHKRKDSIDKTLPSRMFNKFVSYVTGIPLHDFNCPFKAYRKEVLQEIDLHGGLYRYTPVLASSRGFSIAEIKIRNSSRQHGKSKYGIERYMRSIMDLLTVIFVTRFAKRPLHFLGAMGVFACTSGFGILFFFIACHFLYKMGVLTDSGWNIHDRPALSLAILLAILGVQFFSIGLVGELIVLVFNSKNKDRGYSVKKILGD